MAAAKPVPDDDIDAGPPASLEIFLAEQDAAAKAKASPPASAMGLPRRRRRGQGLRSPSRKRRLLRWWRRSRQKPPLRRHRCPAPTGRSASWRKRPKPKPTVKRPPAGAKVPPRFDDQGQVVALRLRLGTRRSPNRTPRLVGRLRLPRQVGLRPRRPRWLVVPRPLPQTIFDVRRSSARSRWRAARRG